MLRHTREIYNDAELSGVLASTSICSDASTLELYATLTRGGTLIMADNLFHLQTLPAVSEVTWVFGVPSVLTELLRSERLPPGVRTVSLGGEAVRPSLLDDIQHQSDAGRVLNLYGPTEDTTYSTYAVMRGEERVSPSLGRPIANTQLFVLDARLSPAPPGLAGEIYLAGAGLARGYRRQPAATAARFVANPFGPPGTRMYRTGDLGTWRTNGTVGYRGRRDHQVKIRGFRVELGEIEAALRLLPDVQEAVVAAREELAGENRLVGYVVPAAGSTLDGMALRAALIQMLPAALVPAAIVAVPSFPRTSNGKLDRAALPPPPVAQSSVEFQGPRSAKEETLCRLVAELLGVDRVGIRDNFFELGGDSIKSMQLAGRARKAGLVLTPRNIFEDQTVERLAEAAVLIESEPPRPPDSESEVVPLTPIMRWFGERNALTIPFAQWVLLRVPARMGHESLTRAVQAVFDHHDVFRMQLVRTDNGEWALYTRSREETSTHAVLRRVQVDPSAEQPYDRLAAEEQGYQCLDPAAGLMVQAVWFDAGDGQPGRLLVRMHHLIVDNVSWRILLDDLSTALSAVLEGRAPRLEPATASLRTWVDRLQVEAHRPERIRELAYWRGVLAETTPLIAEDSDRARNTAGSAAHLSVSLPPAVTSQLLTKVPAAFHGQINDVLLTALTLALARWRWRRGSAARSVLVDLEGHGRGGIFPGVDVLRTVGWFTCLYPVRLDCGDTAIGEAGDVLDRTFKRVKEQLRSVPDGGVGYGMLRYLNPETASELTGLPRAQIGFNYLGRLGPEDAREGELRLEATGANIDPAMVLPHPIEINAVTWDDAEGPQLRAVWTWSPALVGGDDVRELAEGWFSALEALARHSVQRNAGGRTPSDVPLVSLTQAELEHLERDHQKWVDRARSAF
jgi:non-ribosomal peptide synthase protein (TIGR01720 family)